MSQLAAAVKLSLIVGFIVLVTLVAAGCTYWRADYTHPTGESVHAEGFEFLQKKNLGRLRMSGTPTTREVELNDLQRSGDTESVRAFGEGLGSGLAKGARP